MDEMIISKAQELYTQSQNAEEQLSNINEQISQLSDFKEQLAFFEKNPEKEFFASLGKGVFFKADIAEKEVLVDAGAGVFVKKSIPQAQELISEQILKLHDFKQTLQNILDSFAAELEELMTKVEAMKPQ